MVKTQPMSLVHSITGDQLWLYLAQPGREAAAVILPAGKMKASAGVVYDER